MVKLRFPRSPFKGSGAGAIASSSSSGLSSDGDNNTNPLANSGSEDFQLNINNSTRNATRSNRQHRRRQSVRRSQRIRHQQQRRLEQQQQQDRSLNSNIAFGASHNLNNRPTTPPTTQRVASLASPFDPSPSQILPPAPHYNPPPSSRATGLRRPFDTLESSNTEATVARGSSSGLRRIFPGSSSSAKKKQVTTGGLSASFRRATSAVVQSISSSTSTTRPSSSSSMFRSSSVPAPHPVREESMGGEADVSGTAAIGSNLNDSVGDVMQGMLEHFDSFETEEGMDTSTDEDDGDHHNVMGIMRAVGVRPESHTQTSIDTYSSSQDENFPLLALLSPNSGTFFAHADATAHVREYDHFKVDSMDTDCDALHTTISSLPQNKNVVDWMKDDAPRDVLPKILSFLGSRKMNALSKVNQAWNKIVKDESVWRVVCEDTRKWVEGDDIPHSWFQLYKNNPCVPIDYDTVDAAFDSISSGPRVEVIENNVHHYYREQRITSRILVHPGPYFLRRSLVFNCIGKAEVTIESISGLKDPEHAVVWWHNYHNSSSSESPKQQLATLSTGSVGSSEARRSSASLRHFFGCRFMSAAVDTSNTENINDGSENNPMFIPIHASRGIRNGIYNNIPCYEGPNPTAFLILESRRLNEPVVRIRQGNVHLRGLKLLHYCAGGDIWNGNAAVQVQSPFGPDDRPRLIVPPSVVPTANVSHCDIMSMSGRGFVIIDGGISHIDSCSIHNSAATGIYVGGSGSMATITRTDVLENGNGNERNRRGVARGHSGIYVEQGIAKIRDCNVSKNSLTGISAVSSDHATLQVEDSDLICNGSVQLEMPPVGSASRDRSFSRNNKISATGNGRPRSRYASTKENSGPAGGHFPPLPQSPSEFPDDIVVRGGIAVANN